ncbi:hypothetical protein RJT34_24549 [Clitoria ternatea]|uniref:Uncharacterized protein n=1 Tax=Clitoria ternatea TaxID=43366 RepID=A0AAN9FQZ0_CLITE
MSNSFSLIMQVEGPETRNLSFILNLSRSCFKVFLVNSFLQLPSSILLPCTCYTPALSSYRGYGVGWSNREAMVMVVWWCGRSRLGHDEDVRGVWVSGKTEVRWKRWWP